jgi:hypothetical protein
MSESTAEVEECLFLLRRGYDAYKLECRLHPVQLLAPFVLHVLGVRLRTALFCISLLLDACVTLLVHRYSGTVLAWLAWLNPFEAMQCGAPSVAPLTSLLLCIACVPRQVTRPQPRHSVLLLTSPWSAGVALGLLCSINAQYLCLLPPLIASHVKDLRASFVLVCAATLLASTVLLPLAGLHTSPWTLARATTLCSLFSPSTLPSPTTLWYLRVQSFHHFANYFDCVLALHPFVYVAPLVLRLEAHPLCAAHIIVALLATHGSAPTLADGAFAALLLSSHRSIIGKMRFLSFTAIFTLVPAILHGSLVRMDHAGSGNANYVFFAGLVYTLTSSAAIAEFAASVVAAQRAARVKNSVQNENSADAVS